MYLASTRSRLPNNSRVGLSTNIRVSVPRSSGFPTWYLPRHQPSLDTPRVVAARMRDSWGYRPSAPPSLPLHPIAAVIRTCTHLLSAHMPFTHDVFSLPSSCSHHEYSAAALTSPYRLPHAPSLCGRLAHSRFLSHPCCCCCCCWSALPGAVVSTRAPAAATARSSTRQPSCPHVGGLMINVFAGS